MAQPVLHMFCGKIAAGKSTLARHLSQETGAVQIAEDDWLGALFAEQMATPRDYLRCAVRLQGVMGPHVAVLLTAGVSVVLDFPANTVAQRAWMKALIDETGADHRLHLLTASDAQCLARLKARNAGGAHPFAVTEAQFHAVTAQFAPPMSEEGFTIVEHDAID